MEGRQQPLAGRQVLVAVEHEHAARAQNGLEEAAIAVARVEDVGMTGQRLLDQRRIGDRHDAAERYELRGEDVAVAALGPALVGHEPLEGQVALEQHRYAGPPRWRDRRALTRWRVGRSQGGCGCHECAT